jgi:DNA-binding transcriptional ArsR family regulator
MPMAAADNAVPFDELERVFHEPNRLAIMSALCGAEGGVSFSDLRDACALTDGNLNRHLKVLQEQEAVRIDKAFVGAKPRTTVIVTPAGLRQFSAYLDALGSVLKAARQSLPAGVTASVRSRGAAPATP